MARSVLARTLTALLPALALVVGGCGSAWRGVPVASVDESTRTLGEYARFTLNDQRVIELKVTGINYPWVEGERVVGRWSNGRLLRVDLRNVEKIEVRGGAS